jgi:hypothetical protein
LDYIAGKVAKQVCDAHPDSVDVLVNLTSQTTGEV